MLERLRNTLRSLVRRPDKPGERPPAHVIAGVLLLCSAGALAGYVCVPNSQAHAAGRVEVKVGDRPLEAGAQAKDLAMELARAYLKERLTLVVGPWEFSATREKLGARVDLEALEALLHDAKDGTSALRRLHAQERGEAPLVLPIPARLEGTRAEAWLLRIRDQVLQRARDARVDVRTGAIIPEQEGMSLHVHGTLDALAHALFTGETRVTAKVLRAQVKRGREALENHDFRGLLAFFETRYNARDKDRSYNLRVAARHVDGVVLMPGEVFDFNALVGERSEANGFRPAPVIAGGELTDGVGGGTCQIAGTLHAAVFFAGLPLLERNPHTRPSSYLWLGLDATVAYPKLNFSFRNDLPQPVALGVTVEEGRVRAEVRGPAALQREVRFERQIDGFTPYQEISRSDPELPRGVRVLAQRGVPGFKLTTYRVVSGLEGEAPRREKREQTYPPTAQIWRVGSGPAAAPDYVPPAGDTHREYRADEYLVLTMGPGREGLEETERRAGRTGYAGWTAKEGMPQVPQL